MMSGILVSMYTSQLFRVKFLRFSTCRDQNFQKCPSDFQSNVSNDFPKTSGLCWKYPKFFPTTFEDFQSYLKVKVVVCFDTVKTQVNIVVWSQLGRFRSYPLRDIIYERIHDIHWYFEGNGIEFSLCVKGQFVQICESGMRNCPWCVRSLSLVHRCETRTHSCNAWELAVVGVPAPKEEVQFQTCK